MAVTISLNGFGHPSNVKRTGWQKETGLGLVKDTLHGTLNGSICPSSPQQGFISVKMYILI